jgi:hypothetical protein
MRDCLLYVREGGYKVFGRVLLLGLLLGCLLYGCAGVDKQKGAEYHFRLIKPIVSEELRFEDESILVRFTPEQKRLYFTLWNKTQSPMKILWDEVLFIDPEGESHWVLNAEETYKEVGKVAAGVQPLINPSVIPPGTSHGDYVRPHPKGTQDVYIYPTKKPVGSRFSLVLPLEINERTKVYAFSLEVSE